MGYLACLIWQTSILWLPADAVFLKDKRTGIYDSLRERLRLISFLLSRREEAIRLDVERRLVV